MPRTVSPGLYNRYRPVADYQYVPSTTSPAELCTGLDAAGVGGEYRRVWSVAGVAGKSLLLYGCRTTPNLAWRFHFLFAADAGMGGACGYGLLQLMP